MEEKQLQILIDQLLMNSNEFAKSIGVSVDTIYHILKGRNKMTAFVKRKIFETYPNLSREWFERGSGEMYTWKSVNSNNKDLNEEPVIYKNQCPICKDKDYIIEKLNKIIEQQQRLIDQIGNVKND